MLGKRMQYCSIYLKMGYCLLKAMEEFPIRLNRFQLARQLQKLWIPCYEVP